MGRDLRSRTGLRGWWARTWRTALLVAGALVFVIGAGCHGSRPDDRVAGGNDAGSDRRANGDSAADRGSGETATGDARSGGVDGGGDGSSGADQAIGDGSTVTRIVVTTPSGVAASESDGDGYCDLLEAIAAANSDQPVHECPAGHGSDYIVLQAGAIYPVRKTVRLTTPIKIGAAAGVGTAGMGTPVGDGARASIRATADFATRTGDPWSTCLVYASVGGGSVRVWDIALSQDPTPSLTGVCVTSGSFDLRRGHVTGFRAGGLRATCLPEWGCDHDNSDDATTLRVLGSLVDDNRAPGDGGGIWSQGSGMTLVVAHSAIVNNVAQLSGGGLYFGGGWSTHHIVASTVSGNSARAGGGVYVGFTACTATYLYVFNSTVAYNMAATTGGGIHFDANHDPCYSQDVTVLASIVTNNAAAATAESDINGDWEGGQFTCDRAALVHVAAGFPRPSQAGGTPCRFDVADALLAPLTSMGGPGDLPLHPLQRGSPAIDVPSDDVAQDQQRDGWIALVDPLTPADWTLFDRVVDGDGDGVAVRDLGAYEADDVWQTELLAVAGQGSAGHTVESNLDGYHRRAGTTLQATSGAADEQFITYRLPIAETGSYAISVRVRQASDAGKFQAALAEGPAGPWGALGGEQDSYAPSSAFLDLPLAAARSFASAGPRLIRFSVTGKSPASTGYRLFLDSIRVRKLP